LELLREAVPFYQAPGGIRIRLLRSCDDPERWLEIVEYRDCETHDRDQVRVESDSAMRSFLQRWHALFASPLDVETYEEVTDLLQPDGGRP
jgi:hypothetical protein